MVNPNRLIKITKAESKDLLDKAQNIIDKDILGPNFKRDKLLKKDKKKIRLKLTAKKSEQLLTANLVLLLKLRLKFQNLMLKLIRYYLMLKLEVRLLLRCLMTLISKSLIAKMIF